MKKRGEFYLLILSVLLIGFVSAEAIGENLHLNIQTINSSDDVVTGMFHFQFNISRASTCDDIIYSNFSDLTTDSRGIISYYLENVNLNFSEQYWLCYYRNGTLINASKIARSPYTYRATNISLLGVEADSNFDMGIYNLTTTGTGFFGFLGDLISRITKLFVQDIDFTGNINGSGNFTTTGYVGIGTESRNDSLEVRGNMSISGYINQTNTATNITRYFNNGCYELANATGMYWIC